MRRNLKAPCHPFDSGVEASMLREISYSSIRMGLYEPIRSVLSSSAEEEAVHASPLVKFLSALLSGGIGSALANRETLYPSPVLPPTAPSALRRLLIES
jgi:hypothetical protein